MIRAADGVILIHENYSNCINKSISFSQAIRIASIACPLKLAYRNNYSNKNNAYRRVIEIKYVKKRGQ